MNRSIGIFLGIVLSVAGIIFSGCGTDTPSEKKDIAIQVNASQISLEEFNELITFEAYVDPQLDLTMASRDRFIEYLIRKELLIQEAARLKLDRNKKFINAIEQYWESTLIRNLLDQKSTEFKKKVLITDDEIENYYRENIKAFDQSPEEAKKEIKQVLEAKMLEEKLEVWTRNLRASAKIDVNRELMSGKQAGIQAANQVGIKK